MSGKNKETIIEDWEKIRCPICVDHPHQSILLLCDSHEKGCRPYICGTGPSYSHCFKRLINSRTNNKLLCPVCHEKVRDWCLNPPAEHFLNLMRRTCSHEACEFSGTYNELVEHVKRAHPSATGSSGVDPRMDQDVWNLEGYVSQLNL